MRFLPDVFSVYLGLGGASPTLAADIQTLEGLALLRSGTELHPVGHLLALQGEELLPEAEASFHC